MEKRMISVLLAVFLIAGVFCGCGKMDEPAAAVGNTTNPGAADTPSDAPDITQVFLTNNHSISGGVKSSLLEVSGMNFIPTARANTAADYVRTTKNMIPYDLENSVILTTVYRYDESGRQIASETKSGDVFETFSYDEQGRLIHHANEHDLYLYTYSSDGQLQAIDHYDTRWDENGVWKGQTACSYENGTRTEAYYEGDATEPEHYTVYVDDKIMEYRSVGQYTQTWEFYEYDEYGNLKYMFTADEGEKQLLYEYCYNESGALSEIVYYYDGQPDGTKNLYFYNDAGDCVCMEIGYIDADTNEWNVSVHFEFTYDENGNLLTEQARYADGEPLNRYYLEYTYAPRS